MNIYGENLTDVAWHGDNLPGDVGHLPLLMLHYLQKQISHFK